MANYVCPQCEKSFQRRGSRPAKFCSVACRVASSPPSQFDVAAWYTANRAAQNAKRLDWARANPEKRRAIRAKWQAKNRARLAADAQKRRAAIRAGASASEMAAIMRAAQGLCTYCGKASAKLEFDHIEAISVGGSNKADNFVPACRSCNARKAAAPAEDWIYDTFGQIGLARTIYMVENRTILPALYPEAAA